MQWGPSERMSMFFPVYTATGCCRHKLTKNIIITLLLYSNKNGQVMTWFTIQIYGKWRKKNSQ